MECAIYVRALIEYDEMRAGKRYSPISTSFSTQTQTFIQTNVAS